MSTNNKYLSRLNLSAMLSNDEAGKAGIGHNQGDELDTLGLDVKDFAGALALAAEYRNKAMTAKGEAGTAKTRALVATAQAAFTAGIKPDNKDAQWLQLVKVFSGAETAGSVAKESSVLKRAVELQQKRLLVPSIRATENYLAAGKAQGKTVKAFENVFESVASMTNKESAVPTFDEVAKEKLFKPTEDEVKAKREKAKLEREAEARKLADVGPDDIAARFIAQFTDAASTMDDLSFENEVEQIAEALKAKRAAIMAERDAKKKAEEASSAKDVGHKGDKGNRRKAKRDV